VVEQIPNCDQIPPRVDSRSRCRCEIGNEWSNVIVELELAVLYERHDGSTGDGLRHACNPEQRIRLDRCFVFDVGVAKAARVDKLAIAHESNRATGNIVACLRYELAAGAARLKSLSAACARSFAPGAVAPGWPAARRRT